MALRILERERDFAEKKAEKKIADQRLDDRLQSAILKERLEREKSERFAQLELREKEKKVEIAVREKETELKRKQQEARNTINREDLVQRFIGRLPEIVRELPEIKELRVFQTGGDGTLDAVASLFARLPVLLDTLGIPLKREDD